MGVSGSDDSRWQSVIEEQHRSVSIFAARRATERARHAEPPWHEWILREFARYWYILGVLAVVVLVPLQIEQSFAPASGSGAVPVAVTLGMVGAGAALLVAGAFGYLYFWKPDGWVDRAIVRHSDRQAPRPPTGP